MSWSPQQQAMLSAMGYTLYRPAAAEKAAAGDAALSSAPQDAGFDRLRQALVRAAGGGDLAWIDLPAMERLRNSATAKRALWPQLRALRRKH